jgi:hypothetical protein
MLEVEFLRSMVDFGLVVLIWLVQIIIYPAFEFTKSNAFHKWHKKYMMLITFVVAPLMFIQLGLIGYQLATNLSVLTTLSITLTALIWLHTFGKAVPLHNQLNTAGNDEFIVRKLVKVNWVRTFLWTAVWILGLFLW